jgi:hypothetical protein
VAGSLWKRSCGTPSSVDTPCGLNRKIYPNLATGGRFPLTDVSGPASVITGDVADRHKYCVPRVAGECYAGSVVGEVYVNVPWMTTVSGAGTSTSFTLDPAGMFQGGNEYSHPFVAKTTMFSQCAVSQIGTSRNNPKGELGRMVTTGLSKYLIGDIFWHPYVFGDGKWAIFPSPVFQNYGWVPLMAKLPPYGPEDSIARWDFVPVSVNIGSVPNGTDNVVVEFGYAENGTATNFYCTSRQEKCLAVASSVQSDPFKFPTDGGVNGETGVAGLTCASGCTVVIPGLPQRVVYYEIKHRNAANFVIAKSGTQIAVVP